MDFLNLKLDKFSKKHLIKNNDKIALNNKMITWYQQTSNTNIEEIITRPDIKVQLFTSIEDLLEFLLYLFQIKPKLLFKSKIDFRIVIDVSVNSFSKIEEEEMINL